jgi:ribosomal protein S18 acetylase RimI-like enzyme
MLKISRRIEQMQTITPPPEADAGFISQLGVQEELRGRGIGTALLQHQITLARKMGLRRCVLDVAITNSRAQALYERLGFRVVEEHRWKISGSNFHVPDQRRMELSL